MWKAFWAGFYEFLSILSDIAKSIVKVRDWEWEALGFMAAWVVFFLVLVGGLIGFVIYLDKII